MTGYANLETTIDNFEIACEIKSYNSRFLDLNINLPFWMTRFESLIRAHCTKQILRGKVELNFRIKNANINMNVSANPQMAKAYYDAVKTIADTINLQDEISLSLIIKQEGVLQIDRVFNAEIWESKLPPILDTLLERYDSFRHTEGAALAKDILNMLQKIEYSIEEIDRFSAQMEAIFTKNLQDKFTELTNSQFDEQRVLQEVAALLIKYTINEEVVRLKAHVAALKKELETNKTSGKKIDFICQEINREINTIGSKNQLIEIAQAVVNVKDALENIREQARNLE
ncbi:YicC/YloC family endoribonuclease [Treponema phagedenis]